MAMITKLRKKKDKEEIGVCADCGKRQPMMFMTGKWCEDCFDIGLKDDMNEHFDHYMQTELRQNRGDRQ